MNIEWKLKKFEELSVFELYKIMGLRERVFIIEQKILFPECDGNDERAWHLFGEFESEVVAYCRIFPKESEHYSKLGRVVVHPAYRMKNLGRELVEKGASFLEKIVPLPIEIHAQSHLKTFYESLKFQQTGKEFIEEGILHIPMVRKIKVI